MPLWSFVWSLWLKFVPSLREASELQINKVAKKEEKKRTALFPICVFHTKQQVTEVKAKSLTMFLLSEGWSSAAFDSLDTAGCKQII